MATMKEVAKRAGVSPITVSRVINGANYVGEETRAKVQAAIAELHYVPNMLASNLRSQQSDFLALVLPDITNSFWTTIARGAEDEAWAHGFGVFICNTNNDPEKETSYIHRLVQRRIEGLVFVPTPNPSGELQLELLRKHGVKFVVVHRRLTGTPANVVRTDSEDAARRLTRQLAKAGRRRIAFAGLSATDPFMLERLKGYKDALREYGLPLDDDLIRLIGRHPDTDRLTAVAELLRRPVPPDAILLANSRLAMGGIRAIEQAGLTIPDDIMVAAFHDISTMDYYAPQLVTAVQPAYRMGQLATQRLLEMTRASDEPVKEIILEPSIHLGPLAAAATVETIS